MGILLFSFFSSTAFTHISTHSYVHIQENKKCYALVKFLEWIFLLGAHYSYSSSFLHSSILCTSKLCDKRIAYECENENHFSSRWTFNWQYNYIDEILLCHVCALKAEYNIIRAENTYVWSAVIDTDLLKTVS